MLCTLTREVHTDPKFIHELKWDGYRIIALKQKNKVILNSRSGLDYTDKYPPIEAAFKSLKHDLIIDGEMVVHDENGLPYFDALQKYRAGDPIFYYAFDLLWLDGNDLKELPLLERKQLLKKVIAGNKLLKYSEHYTDGKELFAKTLELNLEGIVSKEGDSIYIEGNRGGSWLKTPTEKRQEFVIGGWIESDKNPYFRTLLFGAYNGKNLEWIGHSGSGYKNSEMPAILKKLKALETTTNPFTNNVDSKGKIHWVKPSLVANFKFATWTKSGRIRKPATFLGWRKDKKPIDVVREVPEEIKSKKSSKRKLKNEKKEVAKPTLMATSNWKQIESLKVAEQCTLKIDGCEIEFSDIDRKIWKGVTKADLIKYYHSISDYILPYLKDRPLSLHIKLISAQAPGFYIKDMEGRQPQCAKIFVRDRKHKGRGKNNQIQYLICNNLSTLLYLINLGCIDINPWTSRISSPDFPDYIVIDLDPSDNDFSKAIKAALAAKEILETETLKSFVKTSGKTGIHILIPCEKLSFKETRIVAEQICLLINKKLPKITTTSVSVDSRGNKLYLDPNQNDEADTLAAPYAVRPNKIPSVSYPLNWDQIQNGLKIENFTIDNVHELIQKGANPWKMFMNPKIAKANTKKILALYFS